MGCSNLTCDFLTSNPISFNFSRNGTNITIKLSRYLAHAQSFIV
jgi:hypothetical protein